MAAKAKTPKEKEKAPTEYTIDELASASRVPSRTIRFYQSRGALPPPIIKGRVAYYNDSHLERLGLIAQLQDRGLRIKAIRDLTRELDRGRVDLNDWLGLEQTFREPWSPDKPELLNEAELRKLLKSPRPGLVGDLLQRRLIRKKGDAYLVPSPALLKVTLDLEAGGIDMESSTTAGEMLRKHMKKLTEELVKHFLKQSKGGKNTPGQLAATFETLRPLGLQSVQLVFAQEMQRVLREAVDKGTVSGLAEGTVKS